MDSMYAPNVDPLLGGVQGWVVRKEFHSLGRLMDSRKPYSISKAWSNHSAFAWIVKPRSAILNPQVCHRKTSRVSDRRRQRAHVSTVAVRTFPVTPKTRRSSAVQAFISPGLSGLLFHKLAVTARLVTALHIDLRLFASLRLRVFALNPCPIETQRSKGAKPQSIVANLPPNT